MLRVSSTLSANRLTPSDRPGMICGVPDPQATPSPSVPAADLRVRWWSRPSPWLWGVATLLVIAVIAVTQAPRLSTAFPGRAQKPSTRVSTALPRLAGPVYSQSMVAGREFTGADIHGGQLAHLDLRGDDFQRADAAGAVFAGSFLNGANFSDADLRGANLRGACLRGADLTGAELAGADFIGADTTGATITPGAASGAIGWSSIPVSSACPRD